MPRNTIKRSMFRIAISPLLNIDRMIRQAVQSLAGTVRSGDGRALRPPIRRQAAILCWVAGALLAADEAMAEDSFPISVDAGPLGETLQRIAHVTGHQIALADARVGRLRAPPVRGRMTARQILAAATRDTGASYRFIASNTVLVSIVSIEPKARAVPSAPAPGAPPSVLTSNGEILVTASRREQPLSSLPMSIASYSQAALDARGSVTIADIARLTPGILLRNGWGLSTNLSIRGVYSNSSSATIGVYIDDTPIQSRALGAGLTATNIYPALFDLERVEVIQGPQGALFGSGSVGGTIRFITRAANLDKYELHTDVEARATQHGAMGYEANAAIGGPLVSEKIGFRISALTRRDGGWVDRADRAAPDTISRNSNSTMTQAVRGALTIRTGENVTLKPAIQYQRVVQADTDLFWGPISRPAGGLFRNGAALAQPARDSFVIPSLRVDADFAGFSVASSSSYFRRRRTSTMDYTNFLIEYVTQGQRFTLDEVPGYRAPVLFENDQDVLTQELRLTSDGKGRTRWVGGIFVQRARQDALEIIQEPLLNEALLALTGRDAVAYFGSAPLASGISYVGADRSWDTQLAAFGQVEHDIIPSVTLTAGGRLARTHFDQVNAQDGPQSGGKLQSHIKNGATPFLPRLSIAWRAFDQGMVYATGARGSRIGGANPHVSARRCGQQLARFGYTDVPEQYEADSIWNYEIGARTDSADGRLSLQASGFLFDWKNVQQNFALRCLFRFTANSPTARGYGGDFVLSWKPVDGISVAFSGSYSDARYTQAVYGGIINEESGERAVISTAGGRLPSPPFRLTGFIRHDFRLNDRIGAHLSASGEYASSYAVGRPPGAVGHDPLTYTLPATHFFALRGGVISGAVEATIFADNLLNSTDATQIGHTFPNSENSTMAVNRPRTIGLRLAFALP